MFHHSKRSTGMFLILGLFVFVVIAMIGLLLFRLSHRPSVQNTDVDIIQKQDVVSTPEPKTDEEIQQEQEEMEQAYIDGVFILYAETESSNDPIETVLSHAEDGLLALRVPKDMQEPHLKAVLELAQLRATIANSPDGVRDQMLAVLASLSGK